VVTEKRGVRRELNISKISGNGNNISESVEYSENSQKSL
jgi:hypothetical protein